LIEGVCGSGKPTVAEELQRRGYHVIHGDRDLSYLGDPRTGEPLDVFARDGVMDIGLISKFLMVGFGAGAVSTLFGCQHPWARPLVWQRKLTKKGPGYDS
jgi:hypothetical protein